MNKRKYVPRWRQFFLSSFALILFWNSPALCADVTLAWDPNSEADLEGYGVYYRQGAAGPPYMLAGYVTLDELVNPSAPLFTVTGLQEGARYFFAATAFDVDGNESGFSTAVCADIAVGGAVSACPPSNTSSVGESSTIGGGGGGGGGGCFITSSAQGANGFGRPMGLALILAGGFAGLFLLRGRQRS